MPFGAPFPGGGGITRSFVGSGTLASGSSTLSFTSSLGTAASSRFIIVVISGLASAQNVPSTCTVAGVSATKVHQTLNGANTEFTQFWIAAVTSGASGTVTINNNATSMSCQAAVYAVYGLRSSTPNQTAASTSDPGTFTIGNVPDGSLILGASASQGSTTPSWSGLTADLSSNAGSFTQSSASTGIIGQQTNYAISVTMSGTTSSGVAVWSP